MLVFENFERELEKSMLSGCSGFLPPRETGETETQSSRENLLVSPGRPLFKNRSETTCKTHSRLSFPRTFLAPSDEFQQRSL